jgi:ELWxxDGT repeat protein
MGINKLEYLEPRRLRSSVLLQDANISPVPQSWVLGKSSDAIYFTASDQNGLELFASDGTPNGTRVVLNENQANVSTMGGTEASLGNKFFFTAVAPTPTGTDTQLWVSDGTASGTHEVSDNIDFDISWSSYVRVAAVQVSVGASGGKMLFSPTGQNSLFQSDGTVEGTHLTEFQPTEGDLTTLTQAGSQAFFSAGDDLWRTDGTTAGSALVASFDAPIISLYSIGSLLYFQTNERDGATLYRSDGTPGGTFALAGGFTAYPTQFQAGPGNSLYFTAATTGLFHSQIWQTDGTVAGTSLVPVSNPDSNDDYAGLVAWNGGVMFLRDSRTTDTLQLMDYLPGMATSQLITDSLAFDPLQVNMIADGNIVYFNHSDPNSGTELWQTDGTAQGTTEVSDDIAGAGSSMGPLVGAVEGNRLIYVANTDTYGTVPLYTPPTFVTGASVQDVGPPRILLDFSNSINSSGFAATNIQLNLLTGPGQTPINSSSLSIVPTGHGTQLAIQYTGSSTGILPDGNYSVQLIGAGLLDDGGGAMATDSGHDFFVLSGDANHDGHVNLLDFNILASNFGKTAMTYSKGDFNYDGKVNALDLNALATRFGTVLAPPGAAVPLLASTSPPQVFADAPIIDPADDRNLFDSPEEPSSILTI